MALTRHNKLLAPLGALALAASSMAFGASRADEGGVAIAQLTAWPALSVSDWMVRANAKLAQAASTSESASAIETVAAPKAAEATSPEAQAPKAKHRKRNTQTVALDELLGSAPMSIDALLVKAGVRDAGVPDGVPTELPKTVKVSTNNVAAVEPVPVAVKTAARTVTVTIPDAPQAKPVAHLASTPAAPVAPATKPVTAPAGLVLEIKETANGLAFSPESLAFPKAGQIATVKLTGKGAEGLALFVRDQKVLDLKLATGELKALKKGVTELYAVAKGRMYIVPVTVAEGAGGDFDLKVPDALISLDGVFQGSMQSALYPGLEQATAADQKAALTAQADATKMQAPSLQDSVAETAQSMVTQAQEAQRFYNSKEQLGYKAVTVQLIDDRSVPAAGKIYPVAGATVSVVGTEFKAQTDATGHLTIRDMPQRSRFLLRIDDPSGTVHAAVAELQTRDGGGVQRLRVMRNFAFDAYTNIAGAVQNTALGSYCSTVTDKDSAGQPVAGIAVTTDVQADGPFYFNSYGYLDRAVVQTGADGRFCFFNVTPGPMALSLYQDQAPLATLPVSIYASRHVEDDIDIGREARLTTRLVSMPTAQEQLSNDATAASTYKQVDMIDLIPLGSQDPMAQEASGVVSAGDPLLTHRGRLRAFAQAAEFEPTVYSYPAGDDKAVTPLIPRGFVEDMSLYAQVTHNPELGTVLAEYGLPDAAAQEQISMRLVDEYGRDVGDGWYFSDAPVTKAIFFNVPAGTYSLLVETKDGYWLGSDTVIVYNETVSYSRLGGMLRYRH